MNTSVENYFVDGCMRCSLGGTPDCKVHQWTNELALLRRIVLSCGLTEACKWGVPCYTFENNNVVMISAFKGFCSISFFKGALLKDVESLLTKPGENAQAARLLKFTDARQITEIEAQIRAYIFEAIEVEKAGLKVEFKKNPEPIPDELQARLDEDSVFRSAFEALTPGRQRGYIIHFSQPKQSSTRLSRIEKCTANILNGVGMHDEYKARRSGKK